MKKNRYIYEVIMWAAGSITERTIIGPYSSFSKACKELFNQHDKTVDDARKTTGEGHSGHIINDFLNDPNERLVHWCVSGKPGSAYLVIYNAFIQRKEIL